MQVETDITRWQQKQNMNNNFSANIPYEMEQKSRKELKEFLDDLTTRDQRMMSALITLVHTADTLDKLNEDTETILSYWQKAFVSVCYAEISAGGRFENSASLRLAKN